MIKNDFRIEEKSCGCFGCGSTIASVYTEEGKRWLKIVFENKANELIIIEFTPDKEKRLDSLIVDAIKNQNIGGCTTSSEYKVENKSFGFKFIDDRCSVDNFFNLIALHYSGDRD